MQKPDVSTEQDFVELMIVTFWPRHLKNLLRSIEKNKIKS